MSPEKRENNIHIWTRVYSVCVLEFKCNNSMKKNHSRQWNFCFSVSCLEMISHLQSWLGITMQLRSAVDSWSLCAPLLHAGITEGSLTWLMEKACLRLFIVGSYYIITSFPPSLFSHQMFPFMAPCSFFKLISSLFMNCYNVFVCCIPLYILLSLYVTCMYIEQQIQEFQHFILNFGLKNN